MSNNNKSLVYWASPYEIPDAFLHATKNMVTNNLIQTRIIADKILDHINEGEKVGVKVHVGEAYNTRYLRADYVREVVDVIKSKGGIPTLIETQGLGMTHNIVDIPNICTFSLRCRNTIEHQKIANLHGYSELVIGAPLKFIDEGRENNGRIIEIGGIQLKKVSVASRIYDYDKLVVISHFKGHGFGGFGGALKNLGIGCVTDRNKFLAHFNGPLSVSKKCNFSKCNKECIDVCPVNAIDIENGSAVIDPNKCIDCFDCRSVCPVRNAIKFPGFNDFSTFNEILIDNATGVIKSFGPENIRYFNFALDIPSICDCLVNAGMPIIPDLGIFGSADPLSIDKACIDAETKAPGLPILNAKGEWLPPVEAGIEKFKAVNQSMDPSWQINAALKNKLGNINYKLIKI